MTTQSNPNVTVNIVSAITEVENQPQKVLFIGQKISGTAVAGELQENLQNDNSENALFGADSQIAAMIRAARILNNRTQFDAIGLDDNGSAVDATGTVVFTGPSTEAGSLTVTIGSEQNHKVTVAVASGDTATEIGDALVTAITANANIPVTAANVTGTVTFTAKNGGTYGNTLGIEVINAIAGVGSTVTAMASGAVDPVLTSVFDVVGDTRYQGIVWPYADDTTVLRTFLDGRFNVDNDVLDGIGFTSKTDTLANLNATYGVLNSQSLDVDGDKQITETNFKGPSVFEIPAVKASQVAALRGLRLTADASIADIVISRTGGLDAFGGPALASKPLFNTPIRTIPVTRKSRGWTLVEIDSLNTNGVSTIGNNRAGNQIILGEQVTTYKTDPAGNPDVSFKFVNSVDTSTGAREFFVNNLRNTFAQSRLTEGDLIVGRDMANQASIEATLIGFYSTLSGPDFVLTQAGEEARRFFVNNLLVSLDLATGTVTIDMGVPLVTQLRNLFATMRIVFSTEG